MYYIEYNNDILTILYDFLMYIKFTLYIYEIKFIHKKTLQM